AWDGSGASGSRLVFVSGEPGIGKSRLAARFAAEVHALDATVLFGRCDEEVLRPYQPFAEALSTYLRAYPEDEAQYRLGRTAGELARVLPELAERGETTTPNRGDAESERF